MSECEKMPPQPLSERVVLVVAHGLLAVACALLRRLVVHFTLELVAHTHQLNFTKGIQANICFYKFKYIKV